ncbi:hypothetical protein E4U21_001699 [Claviceps maximensis]|nr:hypothetical protein E4U21_001699 [Claviceps maximensis]
MDTAGTDDDDPRLMELETLAAIFPEMRQSQDASHALRPDARTKSEYTVELELPVEPTQPVTVVFPAASSASNATHATHDGLVGPGGAAMSTTCLKQNATTRPEPVDTLLVSHLPPLSLSITLPDGYPLEKAPRVSLTTAPLWLGRATLRALEDDGSRLWEEAGRDMVAFTYIDHLQREAENVFGTISADGVLEVNSEHKLAVLDFDIKARKAAFEKETFECGICLERASHVAANAVKSKIFISPSELLQIGLTKDMVKRYVNLKYKTELEADKDTIYCPRQWCNGAARSKKHRKPQGLDFTEPTTSSFAEQEMEDQGHGESNHDNVNANAEAEQTSDHNKANKKFNPADLLCICEDCNFAFCGRCLQTWHGEFVRCMPKRSQDELTEEEKASLEYLQLHTSPCPTCNAPAQKTHGCNHMICSRCDTHFCYLCSSWLDPANPYDHYNSPPNGKVATCYMRLWELEDGDGDDVGLDFVGGRGPGDAPAPVAAADVAAVAEAEAEAEAGELLRMILEHEESDTDEGEGERDEVPLQHPVDVGGNPVAVAREAPLVLRRFGPHLPPLLFADRLEGVEVAAEVEGEAEVVDAHHPYTHTHTHADLNMVDRGIAVEKSEQAATIGSGAPIHRRLGEQEPAAAGLELVPVLVSNVRNQSSKMKLLQMDLQGQMRWTQPKRRGFGVSYEWRFSTSRTKSTGMNPIQMTGIGAYAEGPRSGTPPTLADAPFTFDRGSVATSHL